MKHVTLLTAMLILPLLSKGAPDEIRIYKQMDGFELTLHIFNPPNHNPSDKTPCIIFFHGGGWSGGAPHHFYHQSDYLASRGMVAISAEYRLRKTHGTSPIECVKDAKSAIRWVRSHADELGIDPGKLAAGGGSAGGHLATATATLEGFNEEGEDTSISCRPDALVLFNPVFDNGPDGYGHGVVKEYWQDFSPMHNLSAATPPTLVMIGTNDDKVPVATAEKYKATMEQNGTRCDLRLYEGEKHAFFHVSKYYETVIEMDKFLASLGYLQGEPTLRRKDDKAAAPKKI
jgi:acetyl esterase